MCTGREGRVLPDASQSPSSVAAGRPRPTHIAVRWLRCHRALGQKTGSTFQGAGARVGVSPGTASGPGGAEGLSVAHPGGHFFLLGTRGRQVSSRGAADVRTCGRVAAVSRGPSLWATPDGAGSRQLQPGKPRRPPEGPDRDGVCGTRPAGADRSRRGGQTAGCASKAAFTKLVSWPPLHTLNQTPRETSGRQPGRKDDHPQGDLRPGAPSLRSLSAQVADERTGLGVAPGSPVQLAGLAPIRLVRSTLGEVITSLTCPPGSTEDAGP